MTYGYGVWLWLMAYGLWLMVMAYGYGLWLWLMVMAYGFTITFCLPHHLPWWKNHVWIVAPRKVLESREIKKHIYSICACDTMMLFPHLYFRLKIAQNRKRFHFLLFFDDFCQKWSRITGVAPFFKIFWRSKIRKLTLFFQKYQVCDREYCRSEH